MNGIDGVETLYKDFAHLHDVLSEFAYLRRILVEHAPRLRGVLSEILSESEFAHFHDVLLGPTRVEQHGPATLTGEFVDKQYAKALLLAVASGFEAKLAEIVRTICRDCITGDNLRSDAHPLMGLVESKVISREYSKWFDWDAKNANRFFRMFGKGFSDYAQAEVMRNATLSNSIRSFVTIGRERNNLVHKDFASFEMENSALDIYKLYKDAQHFLTWIPGAIRAYLDKLGYP